jgi:DNA-binding NarL/FixJ family response regulator
MPIRVAIVEDHDDFREGLYHVLRGTEGFACVGRYPSAETAIERMPPADVVLLDIGLPGKSGIETLPDLKAKHPGAQVIMLTGLDDDDSIFEAILAGANGYMLKKTPPARLLQAIEEAAAGGMPMAPFVARKAIELFRKFVPAGSPEADLTLREREILALLVDGLGYAHIAERLFISLDTVRNHIRHIYEKLQVHSKSQAVAKALKQRLV